MDGRRDDLSSLLDCAVALADRQPLQYAEGWTDLGDCDREGIEVLRAIARLATLDPEAAESEPVVGCWGDYELAARVGEGAFGEVYRARDLRLDRHVAIKLRRPRGEESAADRARMLAEGRLLARVDHPNVVSVIAAEEHGGRFGLVMAWIEGESLGRALDGGPLSVDEALGVGTDVAAALEVLHRQGIVHRDVKAENVMRSRDGRFILVDFGIGVETDRFEDDGSVSGTPLYIAPELWRGAPPSPASDIYSLGVLLYNLLSGRFPVEAGTVRDLRFRERGRPPVALADVRSGLPRPLYRLIASCLDERPEDRPGTAAEVVAVCSRLLQRKSRRVRRAAAGALSAFLFAAIGLWHYTGSRAADVTTRSAVARRLYGVAEIANARGIQSVALSCAVEATRIDPSFVSAWALAAVAAKGQGEHGRAAELAASAASMVGLAIEPGEAEQIRISIAMVQHDYPAALAAAGELASLRPDATPYLRQGAQAAMRLGRFEEALRIQRRVLASSPEVGELGTLLDPLFALGRWREVSSLLDRWQHERPHEPYLMWQRGAFNLALGDESGAAGAFLRLKRAADPTLAEVGVAWLDEIAVADAWRRGRPPPTEPELTSPHWHQRSCLARLAFAVTPQGSGRTEITPSTCLERLTGDSDPAWFRALGRLAAEASDRPTLDAALDALERRRNGRHPPVLDVAVLQLEAERERLSGRLGAATGLLDEAERRWWPDIELALSRHNLLRQRDPGGRLAALTAALRQRCGEFLVAGVWFEFVRLGENACPGLDRASIDSAAASGEKPPSVAVCLDRGNVAPP